MKPWSSRPALPRPLRDWLRGEGSLTARLRAGAERLEVRRSFEGTSWPTADELVALGLRRRFRAHVREVQLWRDDQLLVAARSVLCARHARGVWRAVRGLGERPLAELLFGRRPVPRAPLEFARLHRGMPCLRRLRRAWPERLRGDVRRAWARRSVFRRRGAPLLLTECFLPALGRLDPDAGAPPTRPPVRRRPARRD
ncbi:chorismate--pyruvate lyase family protein [Caldimonas tepidiphila]|uniref:chorismate--pyruvate lyase family protein n=1 Tax=Caldimonas tepidiphila TaxID=2315841 RepID=UPI000E5AEC17|nr:chorismate lyase [Caldimonas tepidiphila]